MHVWRLKITSFHLTLFKYMAKFHIGLDFGTSQTKACLYNIDNKEREFIVFTNNSFFLPTLITKTNNDLFRYGNDNIEGKKYRYFKMATAEDDELIHVTNEDLNGKLVNSLDSYRKYNTNYDIKPEILSILYLTYVYLYIKNTKSNTSTNTKERKGALGRFAKEKHESDNTFSIKMGIPTEWNNKLHLKRKLKFETILIIVTEFSNTFSSLDEFLNNDSNNLIDEIKRISLKHLKRINGLNLEFQHSYIKPIIDDYKVSVYPETAGGLEYLLATKRLPDGYFATIDIGAGTSDISIVQILNNKINKYLCSESVGLASNDVYTSMMQYQNTFENIKKTEVCYRDGKIDEKKINNVLLNIHNKLEFIIRKTYYRKHFKPLMDEEDIEQKTINVKYADSIRTKLTEQYIIIYGGGANFPIINNKKYMFFQNMKYNEQRNRYFNTKLITEYITEQIEIKNSNKVRDDINLLILAWGLSYLSV